MYNVVQKEKREREERRAVLRAVRCTPMVDSAVLYAQYQKSLQNNKEG